MFPESIRQDTYRTPKTLLDSAIKDLKLTKSQTETLQQDIKNLPDYVDCYDPPPPSSDPPERELVEMKSLLPIDNLSKTGQNSGSYSTSPFYHKQDMTKQVIAT